MSCWMTACERQIYNIRKQFFYNILHQDISWFDKNQSGTLTTKLAEWVGCFGSYLCMFTLPHEFR
jgi:ATP-binding cassette subfamily B (MDR/TAP) protein 1